MTVTFRQIPVPPLQAAPSKDAMRRLVGGVGVIRAGQRGETRTRNYRRLHVITACLSRPAGLEDFWVTASAMVPLTRRLHYLVAVRPGWPNPPSPRA
jgi:hypothetical protein